ncbi:hypothetical protein SLA2020_005080 [Shorea laevis]
MADTESREALRAQTEKKCHEEQQNDELEEEEEGDGDLEAGEEERKEESEVSEFRGAELLSGAEVRETQSETLAGAGLPENSTLELPGGSELKVQDKVFHQEVLPSSRTQCAEAQTQNQLQLSVFSQTVPEEILSGQKVNGTSMHEANQKNSPDFKRVSVLPILKTPVSDGYNWRKYGQKQVKSPKGSRSYYKCTYSECHAKKIECSDDTGHIIEIVNKGQHSHDPPRKNNCTRESRVVSSAEPVLQSSVTEHSIRMPNISDPSTSSKELMLEMTVVPERKRQHSSSDRNGETQVKEEHVREPDPKRRVKKDNMDSPGSVVKPGKKPKFVVHAAGDVGISADGYRWRKYGQKMVKGNPHPRNYYRCTSAGCPVRKHIETAVDNSNAIIITYKGMHDHDMPVPKKRHGPPSAPLVAATASAAMNNMQLKKSDTSENQITSTQWSVGTEGELTGEALDLGGEKAMESARTLLSIGFEIKPC